MLHTGMRPEEVFRVEARNVDLRRKTVFNPWGKTKAAKRVVSLDEEALGILRRRTELAQRAKSRYVLWSPQGPGRPGNKERTIGSVRKAHDAAINRAGVEDFRLYDLGHTFDPSCPSRRQRPYVGGVTRPYDCADDQPLRSPH